MTTRPKTLEADELERLQGVKDIEQEDFFNCVFYACFRMMARACAERQVSTKMARHRGAEPLSLHPHCASGDCEIGKVIASKITGEVEPHVVALGSYRNNQRKRHKVQASGQRRCKGEGCSRLLRSDNRRGVCGPCAMTPPFRKSRAKKTTGS